MARHSTLVVVAAFASAAMVAYMASTASTGFVGSRTAVRASVDRSMPVPFMQSAGKPRSPKPSYDKVAKQIPMKQQMAWTGGWVDPYAMFSSKANFARPGKAKSAVKYPNNKPAVAPKTLSKKAWTGNLNEHYAKLIAKGQPYVAPSMEKAASTTSIKMPGSWIGSASDWLLTRTLSTMEKQSKPMPKIKMWMTVGDPNGPWKKEEVKALKAPAAKAVPEAVVATEPVATEEVEKTATPASA